MSTSPSPLTTTSRTRWTWSVVALLIPAVGALLHSMTSSRTLAGIPGPHRPALAFDQYMVNFGEPHPRAIHEAQFHFENRSDRPVKVTDIKPSCGCLTPKLVGFNAQRRHEERTEFAPGEHGILAMGIRPAKEQPGNKSYTVQMSYNDGSPRTELLEFRITLPTKKLTVEPNELYFYQLSGEPDSRLVVVRDCREKPAKVTGAEVVVSGKKGESQPFPGLSVTIGEMTPGPDGESTWPLQVDVAPNQPTGSRKGWLVISTDDADAPLIKIPILLYGREQATAGGTPPPAKIYGPAPPQSASASDSSTLE